MAQVAAGAAVRQVPLAVKLRLMLGRDWTVGIPFVIPVVILCIGFVGYPVVFAMYLSFTTKIAGRPEEWVGFQNYISLWEDSNYRSAVWNTTYYTVVSVFFKFCVGIGLAMLLNMRLPARNIFTGLALLPWIAPPVVTALVWQWLYEPTFGAFNYMLVNVFHFAPKGLDFLGDRNFAMPAVIFTVIWRGFPFFAVMLLAGLKAINQELYEAASADGADALRRFWYITMPGLRNVSLVVVLLATIWTFNDFTIVWNLTQGGPAGSTELYSILTYKVAFRSLMLGKGVAISATMMPVLIVIVIVLARYMRRR